MLGSLKLPLRKNRFYTVFGGPYIERILAYKGVNLAAEITKPADVRLAIEDFSIPAVPALNKALDKTVDLIIAGHPVYAGCMGGRGRTGLFLAILAKTFGVKDPVQYVRTNYFSHAVETQEQKSFVESYQIPKAVTNKLRWARLRSYLKRRNSLTNVPDITV
jgi:protein-tyrosine phosphatase